MRVLQRVLKLILFPFLPFKLFIDWLISLFLKWLQRYQLFFPTLLYFGIPFLLALGGFSLVILFYVQQGGYNIYQEFNLPNVLWNVALLVGLLIFIHFCKNFALPLWYIRSVFRHQRDLINKGYVITYSGAPGTGKTLSLTYDMFFLAGYAWAELNYVYLRDKARLKLKREFGCIEDLWQLRNVRAAVEYFRARPELIPLLVSNYGIRDKFGRFSAVLDNAVFLQKARLPENAVVALDEYADILSNTRSNVSVLAKSDELLAENLEINTTVSKVRHFGNWRIGAAEQDSGEGYIGFRRVVSLNRILLSCVKVCEPVLLLKMLDRLRTRALMRDHCSARTFKKEQFLQGIVNKIGFFQIRYKDHGNSQNDNELKAEGYYCLPRNLPCMYNSRAYEFEYKGFELQLALDAHGSLFMPAEEEELPPEPSQEELVKLELELWKKTDCEERLARYRREQPARHAFHAANNVLPDIPAVGYSQEELVKLELELWKYEDNVEKLRKYRRENPARHAEHKARHTLPDL